MAEGRPKGSAELKGKAANTSPYPAHKTEESLPVSYIDNARRMK